MSATYRSIAAALRQAISEGRYVPGDTLPQLTELQEEHGVGYQTVRSAISLLESEGLVEAIRRRGTVVRGRPQRSVVMRAREVHRDDIGYFFDLTAQDWIAVATPTVRWGVVPMAHAARMGVPIGEEVLIRDRVMGARDSGEPTQLATSYLPAEVARGTRLAEANTGHGGIYDRLEEMGHRPLRWQESVSARMPSPEEAEALRLPIDVGVPLLSIVRVAISPTEQVVELNDTRMSAEDFEVGYELRRSPSAQLPEDQ